jgi:Sulfotransferase domain
MPGDKQAGARAPILALWSAPRSRSTAFARMMAERGDHTVLHEPFSRVVNFGETKVGEYLTRSEQDLISALWRLAQHGPVFFKDTTDFHYPRLLADQDFLAANVHTFLIRHPAEAIASHYRLNPALQRDEIGFAWLAEIYDAVATATAAQPVVIDSDDLVARPHETVRAYCGAVGIPFIPEALSWQPGMHEAWQRTGQWHQTASQTAGFTHTSSAGLAAVEASPLLADYLKYHLPFYDRLRAVALRV